jgi:hydroxymethylglutaryl-CoA reductase
MVVQGIQKGHMALHSKNIAVAAGVPTHLVEEVSKYMSISGKIS